MTVEEPTLVDGQTEIVMVVHDECCFSAHDGKDKVWALRGHEPIKKKGEGKSIMISEFLCECHGHLRITEDQAREKNVFIKLDGTVDKDKLVARQTLHIGANDEGYWTNAHLAAQLKD